MKNELFKEVERLLDEETQRIIRKIVSLYNDKKVVNKSFSTLIKSFLDEDFKYYATEIELRAYSFLPKEYAPDPEDKYPLVRIEEHKINHLVRYSKWCRSSRQNKDHIKAAKGMSKSFIRDYNRGKTEAKSIMELVADNMNIHFPTHHDSVDARAVILYLQTEIETNGYEIVSTVPFKICKRMME